ncbi:hybrid sensor histidine kinase/response regulator [Sulfurimonas sp.]|uniref:hybrid sensor histidine kinase/response regulator n=1 Tax=Sulfurimonas sp. TaxID=2022749 RepID=UPI0026297C7B|nr:hybrid sensor histidine kinase/response regulator [Sulfurimonas sp.]
MQNKTPILFASQDVFLANKFIIVHQWVEYHSPKSILQEHNIDEEYFIKNYANGVFDYFMGVISGKTIIGNCPVMKELLVYLKYREISADELFELCSHFRRSMLDFSYDSNLNSKQIFEEISYIFDKNFRGILKFYTDAIFQKLIDAIQEAMLASQAKEYFLSNMSHEIRTPLNAILGFVNLLINEDISKKHRNYLNIILNSGENLLSIINDILDFSKLRSGEFTIEPKVFSLHEELSHTMELFVASANSKDITIISFINPNIAKELFGDILRIKQILSNFLSNAIKFTPESGVIVVEAECNDGYLKINVTDSGIGISAAELTHIFEAFAQAQEHVEYNKNGTGLGLSISNQLAKLMGGNVGATSIVGEGSTFYVEIPIEVISNECNIVEDIKTYQELKMAIYAKDMQLSVKHKSFIKYAEVFGMQLEVIDTLESKCDIFIFVHEEHNAAFVQKVLASKKHSIALMSREYDDYDKYKSINSICFPLYCSKIHKAFDELINPRDDADYDKKITNKFKGHILIAEDNEANQELIKIILTKYGLTFDVANNGLAAFELYKTNKYDLILMDEQMPVMDGIESVSKIIEYEELHGLRHTPISALTANVIKGAKERGLLSGFDAFLGKPVILKELERLFMSYVKLDSFSIDNDAKDDDRLQNSVISGLDTQKLCKELMLSNDELVMLLTLFLKKMRTTLPDLCDAIELKQYKKIALLCHSIKGSSGNFRLELLQNIAGKMEVKAKEEDESYDFMGSYKIIKEKLDQIKII